MNSLHAFSLVLLALLAAWPGLAPAVDLGELTAIYARQAQVKGFTPPLAPAEFAADFTRFTATGEFKTTIDTPKSAGDPRLGPRLKRLIAARQVKSGGDWSQELTTLEAPATSDGVGLTLLPKSAADSEALLNKVRSQGGEGLVASATGTVLATVPGDRLEALLDATPTSYLDLQPRYESYFGPTTGEGVAMMQVPALHNAGVKGQGVTVAVLDLGFQGYSQLVRAGELPEARATQAAGRLPFEASTVHGTACAEIVADVAPAAEQVLVRFDGDPQSLQQALQWLRQQKGVVAVNASWGSHLRRIDGLDATDQEIDRFVRDTGVVWINAAGNEAEQTWTGPAVDRNGDGWVDIAVGNETRNFLIVKANGPYYVQVQWDDWGSSVQPTATQDLDAYLFVKQGGQWVLWDRSETVQNGRGYPEEVLKGASLPSGVAALLIKKKRVSRDLQVRVAVPRGVQVIPHTPPYSLSSPASARQALAVGAVDVRSQALASYSSNGPSWDRRLKPEISAPTGVISQAYTLEGSGDGRFHGTSAAAPHVVGLAALLASTGEKPRGPALRAAIERSIQPMGQPQPNNGYGRGLTVAGRVVARPAEAPPDAEPPDTRPSPSDATGRVKRKLDELLQKKP
ncbi:MAG: S8 family serine peptidase [Candidatus Competibacter sp.]|nr:S8 family serine peptidase [Candidatus Competibacter sp.]